ncbi:hypothetical protein DBV05_g12525, partial [Lasiodiplodia theobromae]
MCKLEHGNIVFDTHLDSHSDLGINAPPEDRVTLRRITSCAPLVTEGYTESVKAVYTNSTYVRYLYGPQGIPPNVSDEVTMDYPEFSVIDYYGTGKETIEKTAFSLGGFEYRLLNDGTTNDYKTSWLPIPQLRNNASDTVILFLSANYVNFGAPVDDPWYSAHRELSNVIYADQASSPLACKIQQQFCYPALSGEAQCEPFSGMYDDSGAYQFEERQKPSYIWTATLMSQLHDIYNIASVLRTSALASKFYMQADIIGPLPDNQWQIDLEYMHNITLANLQSAAVSIAKGPSNPNLLQYVNPPTDSASKKLCKNQKVYSTAHFNFSLFWLILVLSLGTVLLLLSYTLEPFVRLIQRRRWLRYDPLVDAYARLEWTTNETLQLQRLAHEELGVGEWKGCVDDVPVTVDGRQRLAVLDVSDLRHPRLKRPAKGYEEVLAGHDGDTVASVERGRAEEEGEGEEKKEGVESSVAQCDSPISPLE